MTSQKHISKQYGILSFFISSDILWYLILFLALIAGTSAWIRIIRQRRMYEEEENKERHNEEIAQSFYIVEDDPTDAPPDSNDEDEIMDE